MGLLPALRGIIDRRILVDLRLNYCVGGRQSRGDFEISGSDDWYELQMWSRDGAASMHVPAAEADDLRSASVFDGAPAASAYHRCGAVGYCPTPGGAELAGVELDADGWRQQPSKPLVFG